MSRGQRDRAVRWPALDGLRAFAILLVIANHTGWAPGRPAGAVGVTIFFVLSGFLITGVIRRDRDTGRWSFATFFGNRVFRLVPALLLMVAVVSVWWLASGRPVGRLAELVGSAVFYVQDFFHTLFNGTVFDHTWSLAVEEQFYLLWPLALPLLLRMKPRTRAGVLGGLIGGSLIIRFGLAAAGLVDFSYANIVTNAYALLLGCAINVLGWRLPARMPSWVAVYGSTLFILALLAVSNHIPSTYVTTPVLVSLAACVLLLGLLDGDRLFGSPPAVFLGRVSYAWYLWHFPLLWITGQLNHRTGGLLVCAAALVVASASTLFLEEPLRRWWHARRREVPVLGPGPVEVSRARRPSRRPRSAHRAD